MNFFRVCFLFLGLAAGRLVAEPSYVTFPSDVDWVTRSSAHFDTIYRRGNDAFAERALKAAERAYALLTPIFPQVPDRTWMVLADWSDSTNGYALPFPFPHIVIYASPPEASGTLSELDQWFDSVILHEFVHILHIYPASGFWKVLRYVFGSVITPNGLMPSHFHEGLAVLLETEKTEGGRGRSSLWRMYRRMAVDAGKWGTEDFFDLDEMDGSTSRFPQGATAYFFGYHMYRELWSRKGAKGIYRLTDSFSSNLPFLFLDWPIEEVYGVSWQELWKQTFRKTAEESRKENAAIRKEGLSDFKTITNSQFSKWDIALSQDGKRAVYRRWTPEDGNALDVLDLEKEKVVKSLDILNGGGEGLCWSVGAKRQRLVYLDTEISNYYSLQYLKAYDVADEEIRTLYKLPHVHRLACSPSTSRMLIYTESNGKGQVKELSDDGKTVTEMRKWDLPSGTWVSGMLVGDTNWIGLRDGMTTSFYRWGKASPEKLLEITGHVYNFRPGRESNEILAIANIDERPEVWSFNPVTKQQRKVLALLSGTNGFDVNDRGFVFTHYRHGGWDVARATGKTAQWMHTRPHLVRKQASEPDAKIGAVEEYSPWASLLPKTWIPSALFVPDGLQVGLWVPGFDIAQRHLYNVIAGWDTRGLPYANVDYTRRFGANYKITAEGYYWPSYIAPEIFAQWGGMVGFGGILPYAGTTYRAGPIFKRTEKFAGLPAKQSVGFQFSLGHIFNMKRRPLSVSLIRGTRLSLSHGQYFRFMGSDEDYFSTIAAVDQYFEMPWWKEHVLYLGARGGYTEGTVFYNSYFVAGGELLFSQQRGYFLNRGYYPQSFFAKRIFNLNLEYRFPIATVERGIGLLPFTLKSIHAALVSDVTTIDYNIATRRLTVEDLFRIYYVSAGAELRSEWVFGWYLPTQLRLGLYRGFSTGGESLYVSLGAEASIL